MTDGISVNGKQFNAYKVVTIADVMYIIIGFLLTYYGSVQAECSRMEHTNRQHVPVQSCDWLLSTYDSMRNSTETEIARIESKAKLSQISSARIPILKLHPPTSRSPTPGGDIT